MPSDKDIIERARATVASGCPCRTCSLIRALADEVEQLRDLIVHTHVHSGYRDNGYMQMTTPQKALYDAIWRRSVEELDAEEENHNANY